MADRFLDLNGVRVRVFNATPRKNIVRRGRRARGAAGQITDGRRNPRDSWTMQTRVESNDEATALEHLVRGDGHRIGFTDGLTSKSWLSPTGYRGCRLEPWPGRLVTTSADFRLSYDPQFTESWCVLLREATNEMQALTSRGAFWRNGEKQAGIAPDGDILPSVTLGAVDLTLQGDVGAALYELVLLPWLPTDSMLEQMTARYNVFGDLPELRMRGNLATRSGIVLGEVGQSPFVVTALEDGEWHKDARTVDFSLLQIERFPDVVELSGTAQIQTGGEGEIVGAHVELSSIEIEGEGHAVTAGEGELGMSIALAGTAAIETAAEGDFGRLKALSGTAAEESAGEGDIRGRVPLGGTAEIITAGDGETGVDLSLSGAAGVETSGNGGIVKEISLVGQGDIEVGGEGRITVGRLLETPLKRSGISRLGDELSVGGIMLTRVATFIADGAGGFTAYDGADAAIAMEIAGAGSVPVDAETQFTDGTRGTKKTAASSAWRTVAVDPFGFTDEDIVIEYIGSHDQDGNVYCGDADGLNAGFAVRSAASSHASPALRLSDGTNAASLLTLANRPQNTALEHLIFFAGRGGPSLARGFINGFAGGVVSADSVGAINSGDHFRPGGFESGGQASENLNVAAVRIWKAPRGTFTTVADYEAVAQERAATVLGTLAVHARGSAVPTFTRATNATLETVGSDGVLRLWTVGSYYPRIERRLNTASRNLLEHSESFEDASWVKFGLTATDDAVEAPRELMATHLVDDGGAGSAQHYVRADLTGLTIGAFYCFSFLAKAAESNFVHLWSPDFSEEAWIDLSTGTIGTSTWTGHLDVVAVPDHAGWYRISATAVAADVAESFYVQPTTVDGSVLFDGSLVDGGLYVTAAQVEEVGALATGPTTYSPKPYFVGYLAERLASNSFRGSSNLANVGGVYWQSKDMSATIADAAATPFGDNRADGLVPNAVATSHYVRQSAANVVIGDTTTASFYIKAAAHSWVWLNYSGAANGNRYFDVVNGVAGGGTTTSHGIEDVGDGWFRVWATSNAATLNGSVECFLYMAEASGDVTLAGDGVSASLYVFGAQVEKNVTRPSSLIETSSSTASRSKDVLIVESAGNIDHVAGSIFTTIRGALPGSIVVQATSATTADLHAQGTDDVTGNVKFVGQATTQPGLTSYSITSAIDVNDGDGHSLATHYAEDDVEAFVDGASVGTDASGKAASDNLIEIRIGANAQAAANATNGHICDVLIYDEQVEQVL